MPWFIPLSLEGWLFYTAIIGIGAAFVHFSAALLLILFSVYNSFKYFLFPGLIPRHPLEVAEERLMKEKARIMDEHIAWVSRQNEMKANPKQALCKIKLKARQVKMTVLLIGVLVVAVLFTAIMKG